MAVKARNVSVGTSVSEVTDLTDRDQLSGFRFAIQNKSTTVSIWIGGSDVTVGANGWEVLPGGSFASDLFHTDHLYAIAASTVACDVIETGI